MAPFLFERANAIFCFPIFALSSQFSYFTRCSFAATATLHLDYVHLRFLVPFLAAEVGQLCRSSVVPLFNRWPAVSCRWRGDMGKQRQLYPSDQCIQCLYRAITNESA